MPSVESIAPYRHALVAHEYEVLRVLDGTCPSKRILAAHWVILNDRVLKNARRQRGGLHQMTLELYTDRPEL